MTSVLYLWCTYIIIIVPHNRIILSILLFVADEHRQVILNSKEKTRNGKAVVQKKKMFMSCAVSTSNTHLWLKKKFN